MSTVPNWNLRLVLTWFCLIVAGASYFAPSHGDEKRKGESSEKVTIEKVTRELAGGQLKRTEYRIPAAGGRIYVLEVSEENTIRVEHGKVGFYTMDTENGQRAVKVFIRGSKDHHRYYDIDGDGRFDEFDNKEGSSILVEDRWIKVQPEQLAPREGATKTTKEEPPVTYVFHNSGWVKK